MADDDGAMDPTVQSLLDSTTLKWIFVGGKGGVGKTTNSSALSILLSQVRRSVLVISTDPAHNLSDAFDQKFSKEPQLVNGFSNLYAMEVDPTVEQAEGDLVESGAGSNLFAELSSSIPGIDEAMSFGELLKTVKSMVLDKALTKLMAMKAQFGGIMTAMQGMLGAGVAGGEDEIFSRLEGMKTLIDEVNRQFQDPTQTTFVCVCIAEFLSLYETERLVQELTKQGIDASVIIVNQLLYPPPN